MNAMTGAWRPRYRRAVSRELNRIEAALGDVSVRAIDTATVLGFLEPIWRTAPRSAWRLRQRLEVLLDLAAARSWRDPERANPARWHGHLSHMLPKPSKAAPTTHYHRLPYAEVPDLWRRLPQREGMSVAALKMLILTAVRSIEVRGMLWGEINYTDRT